MEFSVRRASSTDNDGKPCDEARKEGSLWLVELSSLDALMTFVEKYGSVVVSHSKYSELPNEIIIYDDHLE